MVAGRPSFGLSAKASGDEKRFVIGSLRDQLRAWFIPERADAAVVAKSVIERVERIFLDAGRIEFLGCL
jgi:hypothetical protein